MSLEKTPELLTLFLAVTCSRIRSSPYKMFIHYLNPELVLITTNECVGSKAGDAFDILTSSSHCKTCDKILTELQTENISYKIKPDYAKLQKQEQMFC